MLGMSQNSATRTRVDNVGCHSVAPSHSTHILGSCKNPLGLCESGGGGEDCFNKMQTEKLKAKPAFSADVDGNCQKYNGIVCFGL